LIIAQDIMRIARHEPEPTLYRAGLSSTMELHIQLAGLILALPRTTLAVSACALMEGRICDLLKGGDEWVKGEVEALREGIESVDDARELFIQISEGMKNGESLLVSFCIEGPRMHNVIQVIDVAGDIPGSLSPQQPAMIVVSVSLQPEVSRLLPTIRGLSFVLGIAGEVNIDQLLRPLEERGQFQEAGEEGEEEPRSPCGGRKLVFSDDEDGENVFGEDL
jgi:hypothetical protein